jgi:hypothetical protein
MGDSASARRPEAGTPGRDLAKDPREDLAGSRTGFHQFQKAKEDMQVEKYLSERKLLEYNRDIVGFLEYLVQGGQDFIQLPICILDTYCILGELVLGVRELLRLLHRVDSSKDLREGQMVQGIQSFLAKRIASLENCTAERQKVAQQEILIYNTGYHIQVTSLLNGLKLCLGEAGPMDTSMWELGLRILPAEVCGLAIFSPEANQEIQAAMLMGHPQYSNQTARQHPREDLQQGGASSREGSSCMELSSSAGQQWQETDGDPDEEQNSAAAKLQSDQCIRTCSRQEIPMEEELHQESGFAQLLGNHQRVQAWVEEHFGNNSTSGAIYWSNP